MANAVSTLRNSINAVTHLIMPHETSDSNDQLPDQITNQFESDDDLPDTKASYPLVFGSESLQQWMDEVTQGMGQGCQQAKEYCAKKRILPLFERILANLLLHRPSNPKMYINKLLKEFETALPQDVNLGDDNEFDDDFWRRTRYENPFDLTKLSDGALTSVVLPETLPLYEPRTPRLSQANVDALIRILDPGNLGYITRQRVVNTLKSFNLEKFAEVPLDASAIAHFEFRSIVKSAMSKELVSFQQANDE